MSEVERLTAELERKSRIAAELHLRLGQAEARLVRAAAASPFVRANTSSMLTPPAVSIGAGPAAAPASAGAVHTSAPQLPAGAYPGGGYAMTAEALGVAAATDGTPTRSLSAAGGGGGSGGGGNAERRCQDLQAECDALRAALSAARARGGVGGAGGGSDAAALTVARAEISGLAQRCGAAERLAQRVRVRVTDALGMHLGVPVCSKAESEGQSDGTRMHLGVPVCSKASPRSKVWMCLCAAKQAHEAKCGCACVQQSKPTLYACVKTPSVSQSESE
eukprot:359159-Chlamydomonas_euryale.AAC.2